MNQVENAPQLRFSGFADAWEQREFKKTFSLLQNNTLSRAELSESSGVAANIHYGDVLIKFGEYLDMLQETFPWIKKQADADKFRTSFLQDGDVVFADTAEDETAGKCCEIRNCRSTMIISGLHTIPCRPVSKFAPGYLGYYLNSTAFHEQLVPLMQGTKVVSISKAALKSTLIQYPSNDKEQHKIGTLFRRIDHLITLHQRKQDVLMKAKKALLEKMFPQDDEKTPQVRFNGFTDAWEQRKLGSVCDSLEYGLNAAAIPYDGEHKYIRITDIDDETRAFSQKDITSPDTPLDNAARYRLHLGDIVFARTGASVGKTYLYDIQDGIVYYAGFLIRARIKEVVSPDFVFQATLSEQYSRFISITSQRSGQPGVNAQEYSEWLFFIPKDPKEQQKIGALFRGIDRLITLHQRKVEKLKKLKMACLEKMFV